MSVDHYENFPVASWLCPPHLRPPIAAIYWFARTGDDLADEGDAPANEREAALRRYRADLHRVAEGGEPAATGWPEVYAPLQKAMRAHALPVSLLDDLLQAFLQDVANPPYGSTDELLAYCRLSANPVGRLLLHLHGVNEAEALAQSDAICSALQLINFWQDLSVDLPRGRCYLPADALAQHGLRCDRVMAAPADVPAPQARALVKQLCDDAGARMRSGAPLVHRLPGRAGWELRLVVQGGLRILERIAAMQHDTLTQRPKLRPIDAPALLWRALRMSRKAAAASPVTLA